MSIESLIRRTAIKHRMLGRIDASFDVARAVRRYRIRRWQNNPVTDALTMAMNNSTFFLGSAIPGDLLGPLASDGTRVVYRPHKYIGLRDVGPATGLVNLKHDGWYTTEDGDNGQTYSGYVMQLPGRNGHVRFLGGYYDSAGECYIMDFSTVFSEKVRASGPTDAAEAAAWHGNRMAMVAAQEEVEYDLKYRAARKWLDTREELDKIEADYPDIAEFARENI